ncbi:MAG TPA: hypothetical protein P5244_10235, partial [Syntrophales bacterium]|nr:hypothetical protein [Syntrophales bacterium]
MKTNLKTKIFLLVLLSVLILIAIGFSTAFIVNSKVIGTAHEKLVGDLAMGRALRTRSSRGLGPSGTVSCSRAMPRWTAISRSAIR